MVVHPQISMSPEDFLSWAEGREGRWELVDGRLVSQWGAPGMVGASADHEDVVMNMVAALRARLDLGALAISAGGFAVRAGRSVRYPDVMVLAREGDRKALSTTQPLLVIEVLSPSTMAIDFGPKAQEYTALPSLHAYLVASQDEPRLWLYARGPDGQCAAEPVLIEGLSAEVTIPGLSITLPLAEIYRGVVA